MKFNNRILTKPWLVAVISVVTSVAIYGLVVLIIEMPKPEIGLGLSIFIPLVVSPMVSIMIRKYVLQIEAQNRKLSELNANNKKLFSILAHDLRTPLSSLKMVMELFEHKRLSSEEAEEVISEISKRTDKVLTFLNEILNWAHNQQELKIQELERFSCEDVILPIVSLFEENRRDKGINLDLGNLKSEVNTNRDTFSFIVRNLYQNALKFTPKGGTIRIQAESAEDETVIRIIDSGIGMDQDTLASVLDPEFWYSSEGTDAEQGSGFGISAVINYLKALSGKLEVNSKKGEGSDFRIILPA